MSDTLIERSIIQAINIIADKKIQSTNYDKTVQAIIKQSSIQSVPQSADQLGKVYLVQYLGVKYRAKAGINDNYQDGQMVKVLIPGNDWNNNPVILGRSWSVKNSINNGIVADTKYYELYGSAAIFQWDNIALHSENPVGQEIQIINAGYQDGENNAAAIQQDNLINNYLVVSDSLLLSAVFENRLAGTQAGGEYGVDFTFRFHRSGQDENTYYYRTYTVSQRDFTQGNPDTNGIKYLEHLFTYDDELKNFRGIEKISAWVRGYPQGDEPWPADLILTKVSINGANMIPEANRSSYALTINTSQGDTVAAGVQGQGSITYTAALRFNGTAITSGVNYYWFRQNGNITKTSPYYMPIAGAGWYPINSLNSDSKGLSLPTGDFTFTIDSSHANQNGYFVYGENAPYCMTLKCVAEYFGKTWDKQINVYYVGGAEYVISSSDKIGTTTENQTVYYLGKGEPLFTVQTADGSDISGMTGTWSMYDQNGGRVSLSSLNDNSLQCPFNIEWMGTTAKIVCTLTSAGILMGSASITLQNRDVLPGTYSLVLHDGDRVFQYKSNGELAEADSGIDVTPVPVSFDLVNGMVDPAQIIVFEDIINSGGIVRWYVPRVDTLISYRTEQGSEWQIYRTAQANAYINQSQPNYLVYSQIPTLPYQVGKYDINKLNNNNIKLYVYYNQMAFSASTNFYFPKQGDPGTNGTNTLALIKTSKNQEPVNSKRYYINAQGNNFNITLDSDEPNTSFDSIYLELFRNNDRVYRSIDTGAEDATWTIPYVNYSNLQGTGNNFAYRSYFKINNSSNNYHTISKNGTSTQILTTNYNQINANPPCNILRATKEFNGLIYYAQLPINYTYQANTSYKIKVSPESGYTYVLYNEAGNSPTYGGGAGKTEFEIDLYQLNNNVYEKITNLTNYTFNWYVIGQMSIAEETTSNINSIIASNTFDGLDIISAIVVEVKQGANNIGMIHIPIYKLINRYTHRELNEWDGNSIKINQGQNYILAPQIGAGHKDNQNKFTGVVMGDVVSNLGANTQTTQTGLFGYGTGDRTFFLDSNTGNATFGKQGAGQIQISGTRSVITGGNYNITSGTGLQIDLQDPHIRYGNGNFVVNNQGHATIAKWNADDEKIIYNNTNQTTQVGMGKKTISNTNMNSAFATTYPSGTTEVRYWGQSDKNDQTSYNFAVDKNGKLYARNAIIRGDIIATGLADNITTDIENQIIDATDDIANEARNGLTANGNGNGLAFGTAGMGNRVATKAELRSTFSSYNDTSNGNVNLRFWSGHATNNTQLKFAVSSQGNLFANNAYLSTGRIGTWNIHNGYLSSDEQAGGYLQLNTSTTQGKKDFFIWSGPNTSTRNFSINKQGQLYAQNATIVGNITATAGQIGGWNITSTEINSIKTYNNTEYLTYINSDPSKRYNSDYETGWAFRAGPTGSLMFGVTHDGQVLAKKGTVGGLTLANGYMHAGTKFIIGGAGAPFTYNQLNNRFGGGTTGTGTPYLRIISSGQDYTDISKVNTILTVGGIIYSTGAVFTDATITNSHITAASITSGTLNSARIADGSITNAKIDNGAITNAKIANATIQSGKISSLAVGKITGSISNKNDWKIDFDKGTFSIGSISAGNITTGTLDASKVTIKNLKVGSLNGTSPKWNALTYISTITFDGTYLYWYARSAKFITDGDSSSKPAQSDKAKVK